MFSDYFSNTEEKDLPEKLFIRFDRVFNFTFDEATSKDDKHVDRSTKADENDAVSLVTWLWWNCEIVLYRQPL